MAEVMKLEGYGPAIAAQGSTDEYLDYGLEQFKPRFKEFDDSFRQLTTIDVLPDVDNVSSSDPNVISFQFEVPTMIEPAVSFEDFVRGAAIVALCLKPEVLPVVQQALMSVAMRISEGEGLPEIDSKLSSDVLTAQFRIFSNQEPSGWRSLLAFSLGAYWLLGFFKNYNKKKGKYSPLEFITEVMAKATSLGYIPR